MIHFSFFFVFYSGKIVQISANIKMHSFPFLVLNDGPADNSTIEAKIAQFKKS